MQYNLFNYLKKRGYNYIPFISKIFTKNENILDIYENLIYKESQNTFLIESFLNKNFLKSRYIYTGLSSSIKLEGGYNYVNVFNNNIIIKKYVGDVLKFLLKFQSNYKVPKLINIPFYGGFVGYFGYNFVKCLERSLIKNFLKKKNSYESYFKLILTDEIIIYDSVFNLIYIITYINPNINNSYKIGNNRIKYLVDKLLKLKIKKNYLNFNEFNLKKLTNKDIYLKYILEAKKNIYIGNIMQIQISQIFKNKFNNSPFLLYKILRFLNPSIYIFFYNFNNLKIIGCSPEILVKTQKIDNNLFKIIMKPIAGTRLRGKSISKDNKIKIELLNDIKELSEHIMLIDLSRNDLSKICEINSIKILKRFIIEKYSHVQHIVSEIYGISKIGVSNFDILRAIFPAGTLTGTPKIKSIKIIDDLEFFDRNIYGGACGYLSFNSEINFSIIIRTLILKDSILYTQSAAGIVADSIPELELLESYNKVKIILNILNSKIGSFLI